MHDQVQCVCMMHYDQSVKEEPETLKKDSETVVSEETETTEQSETSATSEVSQSFET